MVRQASILIVDSDPLTRQDLKTRLAESGHRVVGEADNAAHALSLNRSLRPDVILFDVALSGLEAAPLFLSERGGTILLFTGEEPGPVDSLCETGAMGFLSKPFRSSDLRAVIPIAIARMQERSSLEEEIKSLNERMEARKLVGRAKAILMERHGLSERDAFKRIQSQSIALGKQAHEIAQAIITASEIALGGNTGGAANANSLESNDSRPPAIRPVRGEKASLDGFQP